MWKRFLLQNNSTSYYLRNKPLSLRFLQKRYKARMRKASLQKASLFHNRIVRTQEKHQLMHILKTFLVPEDFRFRIYSWHMNSYLNCCSVTKLPMKQRKVTCFREVVLIRPHIDYFEAVLYRRKCFSEINHLGWHVF